MRRRYQYYEQRDFRGGINEEPENARYNQVLDARNMWCPEGRLEQRPGFKAVSTFPFNASSTTAGSYVVTEDVSGGTFTTTHDLSAVEVGDRVYFGWGSTVLNNEMLMLDFWVSQSNTAEIIWKAEYYDGTQWVYVPSHYRTFSGLLGDTVWANDVLLSQVIAHPQQPTNQVVMGRPRDWATTTINSILAYWIRFQLFEDGFDTDGTVQIAAAANDFNSRIVGTGYGAIAMAKMIQFNNEKRFVGAYLVDGASAGTADICVLDDMTMSNGYGAQYDQGFALKLGRRSSHAVVPLFNEVYFTYLDDVYYVNPDMNQLSDHLARVEDSEDIVGTGAAFDKNWIAQLTSFPKARYILFFNGQLWACGIEGAPFLVRWSAPAPAYKVWPEVSFEPLMEDDNSPITGISSVNEYVIVFKRDSIWRMVHNGQEADTGLNSYTPIKDVSGIGCVENNTIAQTDEGLLFLSENGVFLYNGTPNIKKVSSAIDETVSKIGGVITAAGVNWRDKGCYLLTVCTDGTSYNNLVLVYDYKHKVQDETGQWVGTWWIWDSLRVEQWIPDEDSYDRQVMYFLGYDFVIGQLGSSNKDNGDAVTAYVVPHRIGAGSGETKTAREISVNATNDIASATVQVVAEDEPFASSGSTLSFADPSGIESSISNFTFSSTAWGARRRRESRLSVRETGDWFRVKVENTNKNQRMKIHSISLGVVGHGRR